MPQRHTQPPLTHLQKSLLVKVAERKRREAEAEAASRFYASLLPICASHLAISRLLKFPARFANRRRLRKNGLLLYLWADQ